ncbi:MAG TPA: phosphoribosylanthranilate isomerase [Steroidobacteraceae bacterium]|nr:phosphoribosylanthranilate isomerase [Steroidobacteraceae bacterium]
MWIKICGMTGRDAVQAAIDAGVNAIGFVFAPSKRQLNVLQANELARGVPAHILRVAVMQHPSQALVDEVCSTFKPDVLQTDYEDLPGLHVPAGVQVFPVVRAGKQAPSPLPPRILFEGPVSGTGTTADWHHASDLAKQTQLILAGGLNAQNVADAIVRVKPFGVDVSSGVESTPGVKDAKKILEFARAVRESE